MTLWHLDAQTWDTDVQWTSVESSFSIWEEAQEAIAILEAWIPRLEELLDLEDTKVRRDSWDTSVSVVVTDLMKEMVDHFDKSFRPEYLGKDEIRKLIPIVLKPALEDLKSWVRLNWAILQQGQAESVSSHVRWQLWVILPIN